MEIILDMVYEETKKERFYFQSQINTYTTAAALLCWQKIKKNTFRSVRQKNLSEVKK